MKRNLLYIILFIVLAAVAAYFYFSKGSGTLRKELSDFAVKDTASIDRIFMADRQGRTALLTRKGSGGWSINNRFAARQDAVNTILETVNKLEVRSPVGKNLYNNTMKLLSSNSVKVELYSGEELLKTFYVGHATMDNLGTFMYLEGSTVPFIMHIPGFNGYLTPRFFTSETEWRSRSIFAYAPRSIKQITVTDPVHPDSSFTIKKQNDSTYVLIVNGNNIDADKPRLHSYLASYSSVNFETIDASLPGFRKDSILQAGPFKTIKVDNDESKEVFLYRRPIHERSLSQTDAAGNPLPYDMDKLYIRMKNDTSWYVGQYFTWDKLLKTPSYFIAGIPAGK